MTDRLPHTVSALHHERTSFASAVATKPIISAIVIFFNAAKYLDEAIQSVFAQDYQNWELLLVDDGSSDDSTNIARRYAQRYPQRVRYLEHAGHQNRGMSASRNLGIRHAYGQYIAFLDADDVWLANKLQYQLAILDRHPDAAMVVEPIQWWYGWTGNSDDINRDFVAPFPPEVRSDSIVQPPQMLIALLRRATVSTTSSLVRREIIERVGGFEEDFRGMFEDQALAAKIYLFAPVFVAGDCHYKWRKHRDSFSAVVVETAQYEDTRFNFLRWLREYLTKHQIEHPELQSVLQDELWKCSQRKQSRSSGNLSGPIEMIARRIARRFLPTSFREWLGRWRSNGYIPVGRVRLGKMRRLTPISTEWGFDRGLPVDRHYIERFLEIHSRDICGHVLEIGDDTYTRKFGGSRVVQSDILYPVQGNAQATIVEDLTRGESIPSERFDCIICTQTLMFIFETRKAIETLYRILKPGGVLLMTLAGVSHQISREDMARWGDYWRFTSLSARRLCESVFPPENVMVEAHGNVLVAVAFLYGLAREELRQDELDTHDPDYEVLITVRALKPAINE
jgi:glycosyltransferase involved in cell wall biosynthesis